MNRKMVARIVALAAVCLLAAPAGEAALISSTWTRGDGKTVVQFTGGSDTWTVPAGVSDLELLVVGGGGSSANPDNFSSGAGAGGYYYTSSYSVTPNAGVLITVADGGVGQSGTGGTSVFGQVYAFGGQGGGSYNNGGNQGGYSLDGGFTVVPGNAGGKSAFNGNFASGGGGGHFNLGGTGGSGVVTVAYVTAVPEPASVALALCGAGLGLAVIRSRRKT